MPETADAKHHKKAFQAPETLKIFKGKWHWQQFHSMKTMNQGFENVGHEFSKIQSMINTKCQGRGGEFLFWSIEPSNSDSVSVTQSIPHAGKIFILARFSHEGLMQRK